MPLTYGGGINNIEQVRKLFNIGIEKISINSFALENYNLIYDFIINFWIPKRYGYDRCEKKFFWYKFYFMIGEKKNF